MRPRLGLFALLVAVLAPSSLRAEIGTIDVRPAATLLFPYFEVDLDNAAGRTTLMTIQAATATATLAHVTVWTDLGIPVYVFDIYLTGFDMQSFNMRDVLSGTLPATADAGGDPRDTSAPYDGISNKGMFSQDINYPGATGPCQPYDPNNPFAAYTIPAAELADLRAAVTGQAMPSSGKFAGTNRGDNVARGFVTVDVVTQCALDLPSNPGYFLGGVAHTGNWLLGEYFVVDLSQNFMRSETAVHIEASDHLLGHATFYGRLASAQGEPTRGNRFPRAGFSAR